MPEGDRPDWTRSRLILELGTSFPLGIDSSRILRIAGLSFEAPRGWTVEAGKKLGEHALNSLPAVGRLVDTGASPEPALFLILTPRTALMLIDIIEKVCTPAFPITLRGRLAPDIETQINFEDQRFPHSARRQRRAEFQRPRQSPAIRQVDGPRHDGLELGRSAITLFVYDFDSLIGHVQGLDVATLDELVRAFMLVDEAEIIRSKSGNGIPTSFLYCKNPDHTPRAPAPASNISTMRNERCNCWPAGCNSGSILNPPLTPWAWSDGSGTGNAAGVGFEQLEAINGVSSCRVGAHISQRADW